MMRILILCFLMISCLNAAFAKLYPSCGAIPQNSTLYDLAKKGFIVKAMHSLCYWVADENKLIPFRFISFDIPGLSMIEDPGASAASTDDKTNQYHTKSCLNSWCIPVPNPSAKSPDMYQLKDALTSLIQFTRNRQLASLEQTTLPAVVRLYPPSIPGGQKVKEGLHYLDSVICVAKNKTDCTNYKNFKVTFNPQLQRYFSQLVSLAEKDNVKLIIPLINNWSQWGGIHQFCNMLLYKNSQTGNTESLGTLCAGTIWNQPLYRKAFYTNPIVIAAFKAYINKFLLQTYISPQTGQKITFSDSPAIMVWQLGNELDKPLPEAASSDWSKTIATYIKGIDPNHLVMSGTNFNNGIAIDPDSPVLAADNNIDIVANNYYYNAGMPDEDQACSYLKRFESDRSLVAQKNKLLMIAELGAPGYPCYTINPNNPQNFKADPDGVVNSHYITNFFDYFTDSKIGNNAVGVLFWSMRQHARYGGYYAHPVEADQYYDVFWPGYRHYYASNGAKGPQSYWDNTGLDMIKLLQCYANKLYNKTLTCNSLTESDLKNYPVLPTASQLTAPKIESVWLWPPNAPPAKQMFIRIAWQGVTGAQYYPIERSENQLSWKNAVNLQYAASRYRAAEHGLYPRDIPPQWYNGFGSSNAMLSFEYMAFRDGYDHDDSGNLRPYDNQSPSVADLTKCYYYRLKACNVNGCSAWSTPEGTTACQSQKNLVN